MKVITEKYIHPTYVDERGNKIWLNKYGDTTKAEDKYGVNFPIARKGNSFLEAGYIYAPYIPVYDTPIINDYFTRTIDQEELIDKILRASEEVSKHSRKPSAYYVVCSAEIAREIDDAAIREALLK